MFGIDLDIEILLKRIEILMYIMRRVWEEIVDFKFLYLQRPPLRIEITHKVQLYPIPYPEQLILNEEVVIKELLVVKEWWQLQLIKLLQV